MSNNINICTIGILCDIYVLGARNKVYMVKWGVVKAELKVNSWVMNTCQTSAEWKIETALKDMSSNNPQHGFKVDIAVRVLRVRPMSQNLVRT